MSAKIWTHMISKTVGGGIIIIGRYQSLLKAEATAKQLAGASIMDYEETTYRSCHA